MTARDRTLILRVVGDVADANRALQTMDKRMGGFTRTAKKFAGTAAIGFGLNEGVRFLNDAVTAASDLEESANAVRVVFGDAADSVLAFTGDTTDAVFEAESKLNELATITGSQLQNLGFSADDAADATLTLIERAADMASVFNVDVADALGAINSGLAGQSEPLRNYGVDIRKTRLKSEALADGLIEINDELDPMSTAISTINVLLEDTAKVQGDAADTADSHANKQRALREQLEKQKVKIGEQLLPVMADFQELQLELIPIAGDLVESLAPLIEMAGDVSGAFAGFIDVFPEVSFLGGDTENMFTRLFDPIDGLLTPTGMLVNGWEMLTDLWRDETIPAAEALGSYLGRSVNDVVDTTVELLKDAGAELAALDGTVVDIGFDIDLLGDALPGAFYGSGVVSSTSPLRPTALASGGIVTAPTLALIGEAGPEAVVPLDRGYGNTYNIRVEAGVSDPTAVGRAVIDAIQRYDGMNGTGFRSAF